MFALAKGDNPVRISYKDRVFSIAGEFICTLSVICYRETGLVEETQLLDTKSILHRRYLRRYLFEVAIFAAIALMVTRVC